MVTQQRLTMILSLQTASSLAKYSPGMFHLVILFDVYNVLYGHVIRQAYLIITHLPPGMLHT